MATPTERTGALQMSAAMAMSGTLGYFVLESGQGPFNVVFFRCLFGALALLVYCHARGLLSRRYFGRTSFGLAVAAGAALVMNWVLLFSAYRLASISLSTAVYNFQPFFLMGLGAVFLGERPSLTKVAWAGVAFGGLLMLLDLQGSSALSHDHYLSGLLLGMGAGFLYAVTAIIVKRLAGIPPHLLALVQAVVGIVMLAPMADFSALPATAGQWICLAVLGVVHTCLMYILLYSAIQKLPTAMLAALSFIYPAVAILVDYAFFAQRLDLAQAAGISLILLAVAGVTLNWRLWPAPRKGGVA
ncbi:DMT family transporter [Bordetella genomosp. 9]|uniref:EamA family transporter n=1 Tax=Bordetella genomosp. 9 TaxID=1416803 RepID=A0A1W6Z0X1_9BORD|nr:DMT family transporter [Bordetella genomosp. 9]ARP86493.1 EamA family transporter [Bordetella genomosp. 9]ARP90508.1 EamA family transporter [Bordetella genomosp. 9]